MNAEKATFAAGCFWHVELAFSEVKGVVSTRVGYTGGAMAKPNYQQVCSDETGHAEAVEVMFDSAAVSYGKLVEVFFSIHDPTQLNRQGPDVGTQYRSAVFYHTEGQKETALKAKAEWEKKTGKNAVTEIVKAGAFYPAEEYHQKYLMKRGKKTC